MIKADENQMEGLHPRGELTSKEKSDFIRYLSDLIRVKDFNVASLGPGLPRFRGIRL